MMPSRWPWMLAVISLASGCATAEYVPYAYRVPLAGNSSGPVVAERCVKMCQAENADPESFFACIDLCPDCQVEQRVCSPPPDDHDVWPEAACFTRQVRKEEPDGSDAAGGFIAELFARAALALVEGAVEGAAEHTAERSAASSHGSHRHQASHARPDEGRSRSSSPRHESAHPRRVNRGN